MRIIAVAFRFSQWVDVLYHSAVMRYISYYWNACNIGTMRYEIAFPCKQGRSFAKQVEGAEPVKTTQNTIKILEFPISPRI